MSKRMLVSGLSMATLCAAMMPDASAGWTVTRLQPAGASNSYAYSANAGQQAGHDLVGIVTHAGFWTGTVASWVDLHPAGADGSFARSVSSGQQAGLVVLAGVPRASLWSGTAAQQFDLSVYLPPEFVPSFATSVDTDGSTRHVTGYGLRMSPNRYEALLWTFTSFCPADLDDGSLSGTSDGTVTIEDLLYLLVGFAAGDVAVDLDDGSGTGAKDRAVTIDDLLFFLTHFESGC